MRIKCEMQRVAIYLHAKDLDGLMIPGQCVIVVMIGGAMCENQHAAIEESRTGMKFGCKPGGY